MRKLPFLVLTVGILLWAADSVSAQRVKLWGGRASINIPTDGELMKEGANAYLIRVVDEDRALLRLERNKLPKKMRDSSSAKLVGSEVRRLRGQGYTVESHKLRKRHAHIQFSGALEDSDGAERFRTRVEGVRPRADRSYSAIVTAPEQMWDSATVRALRSTARSFQLKKKR